MKKKLLKFIIFIIISGLIVFYFVNKNNQEPVVDNTSDNTKIENSTDDETVPEVVESSTYLNKITYTASIDKDIEKVIVEYMDLYYKQIKELKEYDMMSLFSNSEQAYINKTAIDLLVEIRKLKPNDLTLYSASYDLDIKKVTNDNGKITVKLTENNYLRFNFMKNTESKVYNIENNFVLEKVNGEYKISSYDKVQDFFVMVTDKYKTTTDYKKSLDKIKSDYLALTKTKVVGLAKDYDFFLNEGLGELSCDHPYDREKALAYAKTWVNKRNTNEWSVYESNCQNFASQVAFAGGIPMDYTGSSSNFMQWKFYNANYNESETNTGYVYTWTSVTRFASYVKNNSGSGMCATYGSNLYFAEAGDIIQVGSVDAGRHTIVSIGPYKVDGKVVDILVNSNTVDLENYPMSAYIYPYASLIKIYGWND